MTKARRGSTPKKLSKIFIIAGEVSGDVMGAEIMRAAAGRFDFVGIGGANMKAAGLKSLFPISDLAVMGVAEVLAKARTLIRRINAAAGAIIKEKPDIVLSIDSPSFALRVIKKVRAHGGAMPKFYHVVAPMVWAWGPWRAKKYAKMFDKLFCFFDFERPYFTKYGLDAIVIGHPIYEMTRREMRSAKNKKYIAMLPGSRMSEALSLMPVFRRVSDCMPECKFGIPLTETTRDFVAQEIKSWKNPPDLFAFKDRHKLYNMADVAIAKSGTGTHELAIMHIPAVVVYRANWLTRLMAKLVVRVKYASLVNILADREIYPELLGSKATTENILCGLAGLDRKKMVRELKSADHLWHKNQSPVKIIAENL